MSNLFDYITKYGNFSFEDKKFNDIDNLVFCSISYANFSKKCKTNEVYSISEIGKEYLAHNKYEDVKKLGIPQDEAYRVLTRIIDEKRYKDLKLRNYTYKISDNMQFCAFIIEVTKKLNYLCFEGTDEVLSGWIEDGMLSYTFPVPSQIEAVKYVNKHVKLFGPKYIVGGHSKGGNLALVSSMYMRKYKSGKVIKVYSNDGPGLRDNEYYSNEYLNIKSKYIHIVPFCSVVGMMLKSDKEVVVKSSKKNIIGHALTTWGVVDDKLDLGELSVKSIRLRKSLEIWLHEHSDEDKERVFKAVFDALKKSDVTTFPNVGKIRNLFKIIHNMGEIDKSTKRILLDFIAYVFVSVKGIKKIDED
ncbi:MAG: DUF2974 domain-containing protein [Bacilli bacterium]|nr:DUF2974 domain-containing protein [Bacilli bacterium]